MYTVSLLTSLIISDAEPGDKLVRSSLAGWLDGYYYRWQAKRTVWGNVAVSRHQGQFSTSFSSISNILGLPRLASKSSRLPQKRCNLNFGVLFYSKELDKSGSCFALITILIRLLSPTISLIFFGWVTSRFTVGWAEQCQNEEGGSVPVLSSI